MVQNTSFSLNTGGVASSSNSSGSSSTLSNNMMGQTMVQTYGNSREDQQKLAKKYLNKDLNVGDKWYLISATWYTRWRKYIGLDEDTSRSSQIAPENIDNHKLLEDDYKTVKSGLIESVDYFTMPEEVWWYLVKIYGVKTDYDVIERYVIDDAAEEESKGFHLKIEIKPVKVSLACSYSPNSSSNASTHHRVVVEEMSRQTTIEELTDKMRRLFKIPNEKKVRLFYKNEQATLTPIEGDPSTLTLNSSGYGISDIVLMDVQDENGSWMFNPETTTYQNRSSLVITNFNNTVQQQTQPPAAPPMPMSNLTNTTAAAGSGSGSQQQRSMTTRSLDASTYDSTGNRVSTFSNRHNEQRAGLCGLSNLGNTCFMNSAIQCMSNVPLLTDFFRSGSYKKEINRVNPLGRKGEIAEAYADLVNDMWSGQNSYTIPRNFKLQLSRFAPQFTGYQQQDSHELLAFLLDGLHEDLNRVLNKPYVELGSHVGKTDKQFADESWQDHKKRNDSIIVDIFHGLLKSTLNCLVCSEISIKFDPFCYLSVPLPSKKERLIEIIFVPLDITVPLTKYKLSVFKSGNINDLCTAMEAMVPTVPKNQMVVCDVYTNKFFKVYEHHEPVMSIRERDDIYIYELSAPLSSSDHFKVKLQLKEKISYSSNNFGLPLMFMVPKQNLTHNGLYQYTFNALKRYINEANANEEINSKLNSSLNVNDEENTNDGEELQVDSDSQVGSSIAPIRSSQRLKNERAKSTRIFNLYFSKDDMDSDTSQQQVLNDDAIIDFNAAAAAAAGNINRDYISTTSSLSTSSSNSNSLSVRAEFGQNSSKRLYKPINVTEHDSCNAQLIKRKDVISISDCFNLYTKVEELSEQDYWYCSNCKEHQKSTKKFDLWSLPQVLVVHLKRFSYSRYSRDKIDTLVEFPLTDLDLANYVINPNVETTTKYNLLTVSNHYGGLGGGHYTAYGQNRYDGRWYYFDDSSVSSAEEASVCTSAAYLLIYLRQDLHEKHIRNSKNSSATSTGEQMDY